MVEGKLLKYEELKGSDVEMARREEASSPVLIQEAIRLPNISLKGAAEGISKG